MVDCLTVGHNQRVVRPHTILSSKRWLKACEEIGFVQAFGRATVELGEVHAVVLHVGGESLRESGEHVVSPIVFAGSDLLFNNSGLLELVVDGFGSIAVNSEEVSGSTDGICLPDSIKQLLPLAIGYDGVNLVQAFSGLQGFGLGVLGSVEHFHGRRS